MKNTIHGYAAHAAKENLRPLDYAPATLGEHDVRVRISHCGIPAKTETGPMAQVNAALDKVRANQARYRMVLKA